jgi:hypothetical protein
MTRGTYFGWMALGLAIVPLACEIHASTGYFPPEPVEPPPPVVVRPPEEGAPMEVAPSPDVYADTDPSALTGFNGSLQGHGTWVDDDQYGTVWVPSSDEVGPDFIPYVSAGHWVYGTDYVWVSDYPWGWVTFHYGRWILSRGRRWVWIPGREYADAWVVWRAGDEYVGWAPAPPTWIWRGGVAVALGFAAPVSYVFCPDREIFAPHVRERVVRGDTASMERRTHPFGPEWIGDQRHPFEHRRPQGPPPESLHVERERVPHPPSDDAGLSRARQYAQPRGVTAPQGPSKPAPARSTEPSAQPAPRKTPPRASPRRGPAVPANRP